MPTASDELRDMMEKWFGDPISDTGPIEFLESHGYKQTPGWQWIKPVPSHTISNDEWYCMRFLIEEWDYGGVTDAPGWW